jgi:hypothetical protein
MLIIPALLCYTQPLQAQVALHAEDPTLEAESQMQRLVWTPSGARHYSRSLNQGGLLFSEEVYENSDDFIWLSHRSAHPLSISIDPASYLVVGNEVGDPLYRELLDSVQADNRTPMIQANIWTPLTTHIPAQAFVSFNQVDHWSDAWIRERRQSISEEAKPFSWFGENYPYDSWVSGGLNLWLNDGFWMFDLLGRSGYQWERLANGEFIPLKQHNIHSRIQAGNLIWEHDYKQSTQYNKAFTSQNYPEQKYHQGKLQAGEVGCKEWGVEAGLLYMLEQHNEQYAWTWADAIGDTSAYKAFPYLHHRLRSRQAVWSGFHAANNQEWLARDTINWQSLNGFSIESRLLAGNRYTPFAPVFYTDSNGNTHRLRGGTLHSENTLEARYLRSGELWHGELWANSSLSYGTHWQRRDGQHKWLPAARTGFRYVHNIAPSYDKPETPDWFNNIQLEWNSRYSYWWFSEELLWRGPKHVHSLGIRWRWPSGMEINSTLGWQSASYWNPQAFLNTAGDRMHQVEAHWNWSVDFTQYFAEDRWQFYASLLNILAPEDRQETPYANEDRFRLLTGVKWLW